MIHEIDERTIKEGEHMKIMKAINKLEEIMSETPKSIEEVIKAIGEYHIIKKNAGGILEDKETEHYQYQVLGIINKNTGNNWIK